MLKALKQLGQFIGLVLKGVMIELPLFIFSFVVQTTKITLKFAYRTWLALALTNIALRLLMLVPRLNNLLVGISGSSLLKAFGISATLNIFAAIYPAIYISALAAISVLGMGLILSVANYAAKQVFAAHKPRNILQKILGEMDARYISFTGKNGIFLPVQKFTHAATKVANTFVEIGMIICGAIIVALDSLTMGMFRDAPSAATQANEETTAGIELKELTATEPTPAPLNTNPAVATQHPVETPLREARAQREIVNSSVNPKQAAEVDRMLAARLR